MTVTERRSPQDIKFDRDRIAVSKDGSGLTGVFGSRDSWEPSLAKRLARIKAKRQSSGRRRR